MSSESYPDIKIKLIYYPQMHCKQFDNTVQSAISTFFQKIMKITGKKLVSQNLLTIAFCVQRA